MRVDEHVAKTLLTARGFQIPRGDVVSTPGEAVEIARRIGVEVVLKPLLLTGKRGKAGLIRFASGDERVEREARSLFSEPNVERLRLEERIDIARELYVGVVNDGSRQSPVVLFSEDGGVEIESHSTDGAIVTEPVDILTGLDIEAARRVAGEDVAPLLVELYRFYREVDAELVEINPLAETGDGRYLALDAKLVLDPSALFRHPGIPRSPDSGTPLEREARSAGLYYIELDGNVGILANGAGLTMATLDAVRFHGGRAANFMEIGGEAYRKAEVALGIVLKNPRVKSLLVNLCGAYARTDVMIEGFLDAWKSLAPSLPVSFSIRGTGQERAQALVRDELGIEPCDTMDEAIRAAIRGSETT